MTMNAEKLDPSRVSIVELPPFRVASCTGFGQGPEDIAWQGLLDWMRAAGLSPRAGRFFGFNNPNPMPGNPNYGYEQWLVLEDEKMRALNAGGNVVIKDFAGGLFAVTRHRGSLELLPRTWGSLMLWAESSAYERSSRQWMEECLSPLILDAPANATQSFEDMVFDIYMPVDR